MSRFRFIDHTADIQFEASGKSFEAALSNAALAMFSVMADSKSISPKRKVAIEARAKTMEELAGYALGNLLAESSAQELFFGKFEVKTFKKSSAGFELSGIAYGEKMSPEKGKLDIKAVTMHEISVENKAGTWKINVILDI